MFRNYNYFIVTFSKCIDKSAILYLLVACVRVSPHRFRSVVFRRTHPRYKPSVYMRPPLAPLMSAIMSLTAWRLASAYPVSPKDAYLSCL